MRTNYDTDHMPGREWDKFLTQLPFKIKDENIKQCAIELVNIALKYQPYDGFYVLKNNKIFDMRFKVAKEFNEIWVEVPLERWAEKQERCKCSGIPIMINDYAAYLLKREVGYQCTRCGFPVENRR